jgi:hypothetical protein
MNQTKPSYKGTVLSVSAKCSDLWSHTVVNETGIVSEYSGYVPSFMPGQHWGDYVELDIDPYTGKILNWSPWRKAKKRRTK